MTDMMQIEMKKWSATEERSTFVMMPTNYYPGASERAFVKCGTPL